MKRYNTEIELTFELLEDYLGPPARRKHDEYEWQCPVCAYYGGDTHKDNLKFNARKRVLQCFADPEHSRALLSEIYRQEWEEIKEVHKEDKKLHIKYEELEEEQKMQLKEKQEKYTNNLQTNISGELGNILYGFRGLTMETANAVGLGYDSENNYWTIPTFRYTTSINTNDIDLIGFEYRPTDFSKNGIKREAGQTNTLAMINKYNSKTEILVIVEGYLDGYALYQYLTEQGQAEYYQIVTCSNGVQSLLKQVATIEFNKYKKWYLFIDNDEAGRNTASKILEMYPFITDYTLPCGCKDFNEHYLKCIKGQSTGGINE